MNHLRTPNHVKVVVVYPAFPQTMYTCIYTETPMQHEAGVITVIVVAVGKNASESSYLQ